MLVSLMLGSFDRQSEIAVIRNYSRETVGNIKGYATILSGTGSLS